MADNGNLTDLRKGSSAKTQLKSDTDMDDLASLFDEEFSDHSSNSKSSAEDDLESLFADDHGTSSLSSPKTQPSSSSSEIDDLESLFEEAETLQVKKPVKQAKIPQTTVKQTSSDSHMVTLVFYDQLSDLEALLEEPASKTGIELNGKGVFEELEKLIDTPAKVKVAAVVEQEIEIPLEKVSQPALMEEDDLFADIEKLFIETEQIAGPQTSSNRQQVRTKQVIGDQTTRISVKQLDDLSNLMGELVVNRNTIEQDQERLLQKTDDLLNRLQGLNEVGARMQDLYERSLLEASLLASRKHYSYIQQQVSGQRGRSAVVSFGGNDGSDYDPLEMDRFSNFHLLSQEVIELILRVREAGQDIQYIVTETDQVARTLRQITTQLQEGLTKARMVPFANVGDRLPSAVKQVSWELNKKARLELEGRDVLVDKMIVQNLADPMKHLVNNAMYHGIEPPEERERLGKSPEGRIKVSASLQGNQTVIVVSDDGAGIDSEKVKRKAIEKGLVSIENAKNLTQQDVYDFLFHPGFTTKDKADQFAGRGVGMDVVYTNITMIRGTISIDSVLGKGTTFTIRLPLNFSICKGLCCVSDHSQIAFPMDGVEDMQDYSSKDIQVNENGQKCVRWRDNLLPFQPLSNLLTYNRQVGRGGIYGGSREEDLISIVILRSTGNILAVQVDKVLGEQEIVIKPIEGPIPKPPGVAGATVLGDGHIMAIADVLELIEIAQGRIKTSGSGPLWKRDQVAKEEAAKAKTQNMVLIVDDSIMVRELLSMSFQKAGYQVEQARDGLEAWEKLASGLPCDLIFCDVEMPKMDGLELLSRIQKDETLCDIPVAMLTSRGAERHRQVAADLGASGYFTKPYLEEVLLDSARRMVEGEVLLPNSTRRPKPKKVVKAEPKPEPKPEPLNVITPLPEAAFKGTVIQPRVVVNAQPRVLIIDDSVTVRELLSMTFRNAGYQVEQARDGQDAFDKLKADPNFDVVFCDIEMPRLNGLDLLTNLSEDEQLRHIPVAMLTSRGAERHRKIAAERGAKGYFTKPYLEEVLLDAAKRLVQGEVLLDTTQAE
jgi:chemotaxis protein histidine kinase CheA/DNA-binding response OmpR family regulator